MKIKFIEGNSRQQFLNGIKRDGEPYIELGCYNVNYDLNTHKKSDKTISIVKQDKWYLYIPIIVHEFSHYLIDLIFPRGQNGQLGPEHEMVEKYLDVNKLFSIKEK